jgi:SRSO17 transposase
VTPVPAKQLKRARRDWRNELQTWLAPFLDAFHREAHRQWAPIYLEGLLGPGDRKSVEPMAARVCPGETQQLHHFVAAAPWAAEPLETVLAHVAKDLVGGPDAVLIIDDTSLVKQGRHSVGVARQYCGALGKTANCQALVSLTLARGEVPVPLALRLYLPEAWADDPIRRARAKVPEAIRFQPKGEIALAELDRVMAADVRFGQSFGLVLADAGYGKSAEFRAGLTARGLRWAVGIDATQTVYPADVTLARAEKGPMGRPQKHPVPSTKSIQAKALIADLDARSRRRSREGRARWWRPFQELSWRRGTKGLLIAEFAAVRVRVADGPRLAGGRRLPGEAAWLVCEQRATGERKYYLTNHPARTSIATLARAIKGRWVCEQVHQQLKEELGLDHFEGRSWSGLHHHALLTMIAFAFLQHRRLQTVRRSEAQPHRATRRRGKKIGLASGRSAATADAPSTSPSDRGTFSQGLDALPSLSDSSSIAA